MRTNNVVKISAIAELLSEFNSIIHSDLVRSLSAKEKRFFSRNRNMTFFHLIYYFIFRHCNTSNYELSSFYSSLHCLDKRISKQALNVDIKKMNPNVMTYLIYQFATLFYHSPLPKTYRGYTLIAEDGTYVDIPYNVLNLNTYQFCEGKSVRNMFDVLKIQSKSGGLYDVMNGLFIDFSMKPAPYSETPLAFEHLYRTEPLLKDKNVLYLADRYYGSAEIISHLEALDYHYCIRGKSYFYKKQVEQMKSNDEWIDVEIDQKWLKRFRFSTEAKEERIKHPTMRIRVVKFNYQYTDNKNKTCETELIYFTNLSEKEFSTADIIKVYSMRWDIEVSYKTLKTTQELERFISSDGDVSKCCVYGKILFHNIAGLFRKELNKSLEKEDKESHQKYAVNITQLHNVIREINILLAMVKGKKYTLKKKLSSIEGILHKIKVPIRPDRHNKRWGRIMVNSPSYRFTLDGRNYPKVRRHKGVLMTIAP